VLRQTKESTKQIKSCGINDEAVVPMPGPPDAGLEIRQ